MPKKTIVLRLLLLGAIITYLAPTAHTSDWLSINGYYKSYFTAYDYPDIDFLDSDDDAISAAVNNRVRLEAGLEITDWLSLAGAYDFLPRVMSDKIEGTTGYLMFLGSLQPDYRVDDFRERLYPGPDESIDNFGIYQNLDRLYLTLESRYADFYIGRQPIAWGSARVINPTDILAPYAFNELDVEDRIGVDAVRVRIPIGFMGEIDAGYVFGGDFEYERSAMFLRSKFYYRRNDISLIAVGFYENLMLGFDWTRPIGGAGFWLEGAYIFNKALTGDDRGGGRDFFRATVGADYSLRDGTYLFMEYHFSGVGTNDIDEWRDVITNPSFETASIYLIGKHYLAPGIAYQITPLLILNGQILANLGDPSMFIMPSVEYNIAENIYLSGGAYFGLGKSVDYDYGFTGIDGIHYNSEFGNYPDFYFTSFRIYF